MHLKKQKKHSEFNNAGYHKYKVLLIAICSTIVFFAGCQSKPKGSDNINNSNTAENNQVVDIKTTETDSGDTDTVTTAEKDQKEGTQNTEENSSEESTSLFSELSKYQFVFSSGAGAWQTILNINADGTFHGSYTDSDMGDTGEDYPNGIVYSSTFEGKFTTPKKVNDYTYSVSIEFMKLEKKAGNEEIIDGIKYIYTQPYGLEDAKEIHIYTPQAPIKELPEGYRSWTGYRELSNVKEEYLPFYGLYNVETESGFSSYIIDESKESSKETDITAEIEEIEKQSEEMYNRLENEDLNQSEMNLLAKDIYELWDDEINRVWGYLKDTLDENAMDYLTKAQREWITMKENEIEKAGSEYEDGSIRPMIEYLKGAELTKDRVYELIEILK